MRHRQRPIQFAGIGFGQVEKVEKQLEKIFRTISFHFQPYRIAAAGASQLLFDCSQKIFRFFIVDVEVAVARDPKRVHAVQN